jgi:hypothetical protein
MGGAAAPLDWDVVCVCVCVRACLKSQREDDIADLGLWPSLDGGFPPKTGCWLPGKRGGPVAPTQ